MTEPAHRTVETNGIRMHIAEQGSGPLVLLCHGFPESWYSWRHQLRALAEAGFRAVAPDMRGYGQTDRPQEIEKYTLFHLVGDMVGLLDVLGAEQAVIAGHDWGAPVACCAHAPRPVPRRHRFERAVPAARAGRADHGHAAARRRGVLPALFSDTGHGRGGARARRQADHPQHFVLGLGRRAPSRWWRCCRCHQHGASAGRLPHAHGCSHRLATLA
jgi:pimeloyl-ACP methyl ester carboxylesterase